MRKICVLNYKGGTGKTAVAINLAHGLALQNKKVLIIDTDSQGAISYSLGVNPTNTLYDLLIENKHYAECINKARNNLDIISSNERLYPAELKLTQMRHKESILANKLSSLNGYDVVLLDCAPTLNLINQNVLLYADEIFLPVSMEYLALVGIKQLLNNITIVNKILKHNIRISKIIPTFYDKRYKKSYDVLSSLRRVFPNRISSPIRNSVAISEAPGHRQTVFEYAPKSNAVIDFTNLTNEVLNEKN